jgi:hypothetical protein
VQLLLRAELLSILFATRSRESTQGHCSLQRDEMYELGYTSRPGNLMGSIEGIPLESATYRDLIFVTKTRTYILNNMQHILTIYTLFILTYRLIFIAEEAKPKVCVVGYLREIVSLGLCIRHRFSWLAAKQRPTNLPTRTSLPQSST